MFLQELVVKFAANVSVFVPTTKFAVVSAMLLRHSRSKHACPCIGASAVLTCLSSFFRPFTAIASEPVLLPRLRPDFGASVSVLTVFLMSVR
jgi:hypothetical protein